MSQSNVPSVRDLMSGKLPNQSIQVLMEYDNLTDPMGLDDIEHTEVTLLAVLIDETGSMYGVTQEVIDGYNVLLDAMNGAKGSQGILFDTALFNSDNPNNVLHGFIPVEQAQANHRLSTATYQPNSGTPLFDAVLALLNRTVSYAEMLRNNGITVKVIVAVISDGDDNDSRQGGTAAKVKAVADALMKQEVYTLAFIGISGEPGFNPRTLAASMGFPNVLVAGASASEVRKMFNQLSASSVQASKAKVGTGNSTNFFNP